MFIFLLYIMNISIRRCYIIFETCVLHFSELDSLTNIGSVFVWDIILLVLKLNDYDHNLPFVWLPLTNQKKTLHCLLEKNEKIGFEISRNWIVLHCIYFNPDKENKKHPEQIAYICRIKFICQWVHLLYLFASCHFLHVSV